MIRRLLVAASYVFMEGHIAFQMQTMCLVSLFMCVYIITVRPFKKAIHNNMEIFNEVCIMLACYFLLAFSEWVNDGYLKYTLGWMMVILVLFNIFVNLVLTMLTAYKQYYSQIKKKCKRKKAKKGV